MSNPGTPDKEGLASADKWDAKMLAGVTTSKSATPAPAPVAEPPPQGYAPPPPEPVPAAPTPSLQQDTTTALPTDANAPDKKGILSTLTDTLSGFITGKSAVDKGAVAGAARIPGTIAGGIMDAAGDLGGRKNLLNWGKTLDSTPELFPGQHMIGAISMLSGMDLKGTSWENIVSSKDYLGKVGNNSVNQGVATMGSLILGAEAFGETKLFSFIPKLAGPGSIGKIGESALNFGAASGILTDPHEARFTSALNNLGIHTEFTDWLGADPDQAGPLENRFKNAVENTLGGIAADTVFQSAKYFRSVIKGAPDEVAKQAAIDAAKNTIPEAAHPAPSTVEAVRGAGHMEVRVNGEPVVQIPSEQFNDLLAKTRAEMKPGLVDSTPESIRNAGTEKPINLAEGAPASIRNARTGFLPGMDNEAVAPLLRSLAIKLHDTPHVVRTDIERDAMARAAAVEVGVDPTDMLAYAQHVAGNVADIDVATTSVQMLWRNMASQLDAMAEKGITAEAPLADIQAHKAAINNVVAFSGSFQNIRSSLGRGLRSTSVLRKAADYVGEKLGMEDKIGNLFKEAGHPVPPQPVSVQDINDFYSIWKDLKGDAAARQNFLRGIQTLPSQWLYLRTSFANNFTANALAGLPSVAMNVVGPSMIGMLHTLEKTAGGFIGALNPLISQEARAKLLSTATNASRAYVQTVGDIPDAFRWALQAAKENRSILGGGWTVDVGRMGPVTDAMIRAAQKQDSVTIGYQLGNLINYWPSSFQRINAGLDEFAKRLSYMGEVRLNALVEHETTPGITMSKADYVKSAMENSIDEVGEATNEAAMRTAERTTLTGGLSGNSYHPLVGKASQFIQEMRSQFPETRYILPVFNVPANSLGETIRRIPGLNLALGETRDELLGHLGAVRQADALGRTMLGGAFMLWAYHLARQGQLTGAGPTDPGNRKAWSDQGYQPYSIRIGDKWVDYSRYDLPGATLAIPANMYDSTVYHRQDDPGYEARMIGSIGALAQYFKDKSALQGASNLMNFGASPGADESLFHRTMNSVVSRSLVPNFVTQLGRNTTDDLKRSATSPGEALMNSLPMASKELDPVRNVLGEPLHVPRDSLIENMLPITVAPATTFKSDPVMTELDRLRQVTGSAPGVTHPSSFDNNFIDSTQVKLENGRSLYDALVGARQTVVDPNTGANLRTALTNLFQRPEYKNAKDGDASNLMDSEGNVSRGAVIAKVFNTYNKAAIQAVAKESPIARHQLAIVAAKKIDDDKLRPYSATDLSDNPKLLQTLGIDIKKYEQKVSGQ